MKKHFISQSFELYTILPPFLHFCNPFQIITVCQGPQIECLLELNLFSPSHFLKFETANGHSELNPENMVDEGASRSPF